MFQAEKPLRGPKSQALHRFRTVSCHQRGHDDFRTLALPPVLFLGTRCTGQRPLPSIDEALDLLLARGILRKAVEEKGEVVGVHLPFLRPGMASTHDCGLLEALGHVRSRDLIESY